jgi:hypothetical protein
VRIDLDQQRGRAGLATTDEIDRGVTVTLGHPPNGRPAGWAWALSTRRAICATRLDPTGRWKIRDKRYSELTQAGQV